MKRVLVIDDATFMRMSIRNILVRNGFEMVGEAENGRIGYKKYMELKPDLVTMDLTMPEMNGIEALKKIKAFDAEAKVIIITAMGQEPLIKEAILSGAKGFIVKPFKEETLLSALNKV
ncbi:MAG TPA: response regulator [Ruminiclostridium sp.]